MTGLPETKEAEFIPNPEFKPVPTPKQTKSPWSNPKGHKYWKRQMRRTRGRKV